MNQLSTINISNPSLADRIRGAVWGQFVGDAFCLGSHWIYDLSELERRFPGGPQGFEEPAEGHYHAGKKSGEQTHYGDGALLQLRSLADRGGFDAVDFGARFVALMESADYKGYRDHAAKGTVANARAFRESRPGKAYGYQDGADDDQPATASRLASVAARHFRDDDYLVVVERATRVCQNNERAVAYNKANGAVLRDLFTGVDLAAAFRGASDLAAGTGTHGDEVAAKIGEAMSAINLTVREATLRFGQVCPLASSFPAAVQGALRHQDNFAEAVRDTAAAGGDNAARAAMIGAWLGAFLGVEAIPAGWRERLAARDEIAAGVEGLVVLACG